MAMSHSVIVILAWCSIFSLVGCTSNDNTMPASPPSEECQHVVESNTAFAIDLYQKLRSNEGNLFFSPYSISGALTMAYAGARGDTAAQMREVLRFRIEDKALHHGFGDLTEALGNSSRTRAYELAIANALWVRRGLSLLNDYVQLIEAHYGAKPQEADFKNAPNQARQAINDWVEEKTKGKIKELFTPEIITQDTLLVLVNAIYFKGKWAHAFDKEDTRTRAFFLSPDRHIEVPTMYIKEEFPYLVHDTFRALELPYRDNRISMVVVLPNEKNGLPSIEDSLTTSSLARWLASMTTREVTVFLPRFRITEWFRLDDTLKSMGMTKAFGPADFSGMAEMELFISAVVHKAFVEVNEEGTEAAAATGTMFESAAEEPLIFRADHPFLFLIRNNYTGSILFLGRIVNPLQ